MASFDALDKRVDRIVEEAQAKAQAEYRHFEWSMLSESEQDHWQAFFDQIRDRLVVENGRLNFEQITDDELDKLHDWLKLKERYAEPC